MGELLAHYTSADVAFTNIVGEGRLRLSPLPLMRDPYESTEWPFMRHGLGQATSDQEPGIGRWVYEMKRQFKILSMTVDLVTEPHELDGRCWNHPRLWDQYADHYRGVCLLFDKTLLDAALRERAAEALWTDGCEVTYGRLEYLHVGMPMFPQLFWLPHDFPNEHYGIPELLNLNLEGMAPPPEPGDEEPVPWDFTGRMADWLLFKKNPDWATEAEYRYVVVEESNNGPIFIDVRQALKGAVLGAKFPEWQIEGAKSASARHNLVIHEGEWTPSGLAIYPRPRHGTTESAV